jgi:hypothetical protein
MGQMRFNKRNSRTGQQKPSSEHVISDVPAIIDTQVFNRVQSLLKVRNPKVTPPRIVSGPSRTETDAETAQVTRHFSSRCRDRQTAIVWRGSE